MTILKVSSMKIAEFRYYVMKGLKVYSFLDKAKPSVIRGQKAAGLKKLRVVGTF
jgi:hypothetical protein